MDNQWSGLNPTRCAPCWPILQLRQTTPTAGRVFLEHAPPNGKAQRQGGRARFLRKPEPMPAIPPRTTWAKPCPLQPILGNGSFQSDFLLSIFHEAYHRSLGFILFTPTFGLRAKTFLVRSPWRRSWPRLRRLFSAHL